MPITMTICRNYVYPKKNNNMKKVISKCLNIWKFVKKSYLCKCKNHRQWTY